MPDLDYALLADYVRAEVGIAHVVAAGIDTINAEEVPTGRNVGLLFRVRFTRNECDRPHRIEIIFQDIDGKRLAVLSSVVTPQWIEDQPVGWRTGLIAGFNIGLPLPHYGVYAFEILIDDVHKKTLDLRVVPIQTPADG